MQVKSISQNLVITTDDSELFINLGSKMRENFQAAIGSCNKIIAFCRENELIQKKYFLKLVSKIYARKNGENIDISDTKEQIKLIFQKANSLQILLNIKVKFQKNSVIFDIKNSDDLFNRYLIKSLHGVEYEEFSNLLVFNFSNVLQLGLLENILNYREHLKYIVDFTYENQDYKMFKKRIEVLDSPTYQKRFGMLANLLEEHFETLGVSADDDFNTVRSSYLELSKIYHPDRYGSNKIDCADKFRKISVAYEALKPFYKEQDEFIRSYQ